MAEKPLRSHKFRVWLLKTSSVVKPRFYKVISSSVPQKTKDRYGRMRRILLFPRGLMEMLALL